MSVRHEYRDEQDIPRVGKEGGRLNAKDADKYVQKAPTRSEPASTASPRPEPNQPKAGPAKSPGIPPADSGGLGHALETGLNPRDHEGEGPREQTPSTEEKEVPNREQHEREGDRPDARRSVGKVAAENDTPVKFRL